MMRFACGIVLTVLLACTVGEVSAKNTASVSVSSDVSYQFIGTYDLATLNKIVSTELNEFKTTKTAVAMPRANNAVKLYRVKYRTVIPEKNNRSVEATGLIALPDKAAAVYPVVSYQHGTVFSKTEVPSFPDQSSETRLMIAQFAGHGYILIAPDYIGKGTSTEPDSYMVKESTVQASYDMLLAARAVLASMKIKTGDLFLSGWSQGAWSTMAFRNKLEQAGVPIRAAATACTPNDAYLLFSKWLNNRTAQDADWIVGTVALLINSYEQYYGLPGLSKAAIKPQYWQTARDFYENKIGWSEAAKVFPKSSREFLQESFAGESSLMANRFYRHLFENQVYQWRYKTPSRLYYGKADEVIPMHVATLPVAYQETLGGVPATAVYAGDIADHRGTFIFGMLDQKQWFDSLAGR